MKRTKARRTGTTTTTVLLLLLLTLNASLIGVLGSSDEYSPPPLQQPLQLWPLPESFDYGDSSVVLSPNFTIAIASGSFANQALEKAIQRYSRLIFSHLGFDGDPNGLQVSESTRISANSCSGNKQNKQNRGWTWAWPRRTPRYSTASTNPTPSSSTKHQVRRIPLQLEKRLYSVLSNLISTQKRCWKPTRSTALWEDWRRSLSLFRFSFYTHLVWAVFDLSITLNVSSSVQLHGERLLCR